MVWDKEEEVLRNRRGKLWKSTYRRKRGERRVGRK